MKRQSSHPPAGPILLALAALVLAPPGARGQDDPGDEPESTIVERCAGPEFRQFDFWIGEWEVRGEDGDLLGHNEIRRVAGGCGLLENWRGATGGRGVSINTYDADRGVWTQRWVGAGATLWLEGGLEDGRMVLSGTSPRSTPRGDVMDRITWTPLPDGRVRQEWDTSPDGGESWQQGFVGLYSPAGGDRAGSDPEDASGEPTAAAPAANGDGAVTIARPSDELDWRRAPTGAEFADLHGRPPEPGPFAFLMRMPANWEMRPHIHDTVEHITVLSGTLYMRFSPDGETVELPAGSAVVVPAEHPMWARTGGEETVIQVHGVGPFGTRPVEGDDTSEDRP